MSLSFEQLAPEWELNIDKNDVSRQIKLTSLVNDSLKFQT